MLSLEEAKLTFMTIKLLAYVGILPYGCNVTEGKLKKLPYYRRIFYHFCTFCTILHLLNSIGQAVNLYVLSDHIDVPLHIFLLHIVYVTFGSITLSTVMYTKPKSHDVILLFNQLFAGEKTRYRAWRDTELADILLRTYCPVMALYVTMGWPPVSLYEPNMPIQPINSLLLTPLKESSILVLLFRILDWHALLFNVMNFYFLVFLVYMSCAKAKMDGRAAKDLLRLVLPKYRLVRRAMKSVRLIQLQILLTNHVGGWVIFAQKVVFIACLLFDLFLVIRAFSQNVILGLFAVEACFIFVFSWYTTCYFANLVPEETQSLHRAIASYSGPFFKADVVTYMRSVRPSYIQDGSFRAIEQESFLIFVDFVVNQLVALLLM